MLVASIQAELVKLRRSPVWVAFVALPGLSALIGSANYTANLEVITPGWENLWTQQTLFVCYFFLPALLGAGCSLLWRQEHQGSNWNEFMVQPVSTLDLVLGKLCAGSLMAATAFASILVFYGFSGVLLGVPGPFPTAQVTTYLGLGLLGSIVIVAVQLFISMLIRSFATPVAIALGGGVCGLVATMGGFGWIWPYSLMQSGMNSNNLVDRSSGTILQVVVVSVLYITAATAAASTWLGRHDIVATL